MPMGPQASKQQPASQAPSDVHATPTALLGPIYRDEKVYRVKTDHRVMTLFVFLPSTQKVRGAMQ